MSEKKNNAPNFREINCESCSGCYHNRVGECDLHNFKLTNTNNVVCDDFSPNEEEKECNHEYHELYNYETDFWECRCKHCRKMKTGYIGRSDLDSYWDKKKGEE